MAEEVDSFVVRPRVSVNKRKMMMLNRPVLDALVGTKVFLVRDGDHVVVLDADRMEAYLKSHPGASRGDEHTVYLDKTYGIIKCARFFARNHLAVPGLRRMMPRVGAGFFSFEWRT